MKKEKNIDRSDINFIRYHLLNNDRKSKRITEIEDKLQNLILEAYKKFIPEEAERLYKKYPFIINTARSIELNYDKICSSKIFYYKEPFITLKYSSPFSSIKLKDYFDIIPEYLRKPIVTYLLNFSELNDELEQSVNKMIGKLKAMTYYDLELYYPDIYKILIDREESVDKDQKEKLKLLEEKIKETIN